MIVGLVAWLLKLTFVLFVLGVIFNVVLFAVLVLTGQPLP